MEVTLADLKKQIVVETRRHWEALGYQKRAGGRYTKDLDDERLGAVTLHATPRKTLDWVEVWGYVELRHHAVMALQESVWDEVLMGDSPKKHDGTLYDETEIYFFPRLEDPTPHLRALFAGIEETCEALWEGYASLAKAADDLRTSRLIHGATQIVYPLYGVLAGHTEQVAEFLRNYVRTYDEAARKAAALGDRTTSTYADRYRDFAQKVFRAMGLTEDFE